MNFTGHGNKIIEERIMDFDAAKELVKKTKQIPISSRVARECIDLAYGFFSPLKGFMGKADVESVCKRMALTDGTLWPIPIIFDIDSEEIKRNGIKEKDTILLTYHGNALAILEIEEIFKYDKIDLEKAVLGTTDLKHPGVKMYNTLKDTFISGKVTLVNELKFNPPFDKFWYTPKQLRKIFVEKGWKRIVAHPLSFGICVMPAQKKLFFMLLSEATWDVPTICLEETMLG
jgi:sulfate adenylyltransferase